MMAATILTGSFACLRRHRCGSLEARVVCLQILRWRVQLEVSKTFQKVSRTANVFVFWRNSAW